MFAPSVPAICSNHELGFGVIDAISKRVRAEAAENDTMHGADPGAGQHRDRKLGDHRKIDRDPIALPHAQLLQHIGEPIDLAVEIPIGERASVARLTFPDERSFVAASGRDMTVETVGAHVELPADEPLRVGRIPGEHLVPGLHPLELTGHPGPESLEILVRFVVERHVTHVSLFPKGLGRGELPPLLKQSLNLSLSLSLSLSLRASTLVVTHHKPSCHETPIRDSMTCAPVGILDVIPRTETGGRRC